MKNTKDSSIPIFSLSDSSVHSRQPSRLPWTDGHSSFVHSSYTNSWRCTVEFHGVGWILVWFSGQGMGRPDRWKYDNPQNWYIRWQLSNTRVSGSRFYFNSYVVKLPDVKSDATPHRTQAYLKTCSLVGVFCSFVRYGKMSNWALKTATYCPYISARWRTKGEGEDCGVGAAHEGSADGNGQWELGRLYTIGLWKLKSRAVKWRDLKVS